MATTTLSKRKRLAFSLVLLALFWLAAELICLGGLWAFKRYRNVEYQPALLADLRQTIRGTLTLQLAATSSYLMFDPDLGWTIRPNSDKPQYKSNSQGLRATREYSLEPPPGRVRIEAFGDSFTHASNVPTGFTWEERLEGFDPNLEVMNFGIPGAEIGQGLLRYRREGVRYRPAVVLIGFMTENINRMVNTFRPFYFPRGSIAFSKPRFALEGERLALIENPIRSLDGYRDLLRDPDRWLPRLGEHDFFYQRNFRRSRCDFLPSVRFARIVTNQYLDEPVFESGGLYNTRSEAYQVTLRVLDEFYREVLSHGSLPIVVMYPERQDILRRRDGRKLMYQPLLDELRRRGYRVIDLADGFARYDPEARMARKSFVHYPKQGNRMAARWIHESLAQQGLTRPVWR
ncbi:MAG: SGNH/GDSL hydrolase family protein [Thermoanaerobaculia bacterium]